jgi:hypothetical protein
MEDETTGIEEDGEFGGATWEGEAVEAARAIEAEDVELPMS